MSNEFTHLDNQGNASMVDVSHKAITVRTATAECWVDLPDEVLVHFQEQDLLTKKGSVIQTAILAGVMGAKRTSELIPLCHPLGLEDCRIEVTRDNKALKVRCTTKITGKTGVEMEALTGASVAALTIYDMCKALSHNIVVRDLQLVSKSGGKRAFNRESTA